MLWADWAVTKTLVVCGCWRGLNYPNWSDFGATSNISTWSLAGNQPFFSHSQNSIHTVDGWNPGSTHQLRLVVSPIISRVLDIWGDDRQISEPSTGLCIFQATILVGAWSPRSDILKNTFCNAKRPNQGAYWKDVELKVGYFPSQVGHFDSSHFLENLLNFPLTGVSSGSPCFAYNQHLAAMFP